MHPITKQIIDILTTSVTVAHYLDVETIGEPLPVYHCDDIPSECPLVYLAVDDLLVWRAEGQVPYYTQSMTIYDNPYPRPFRPPGLNARLSQIWRAIAEALGCQYTNLGHWEAGPDTVFHSVEKNFDPYPGQGSVTWNRPARPNQLRGVISFKFVLKEDMEQISAVNETLAAGTEEARDNSAPSLETPPVIKEDETQGSLF